MGSPSSAVLKSSLQSIVDALFRVHWCLCKSPQDKTYNTWLKILCSGPTWTICDLVSPDTYKKKMIMIWKYWDAIYFYLVFVCLSLSEEKGKLISWHKSELDIHVTLLDDFQLLPKFSDYVHLDVIDGGKKKLKEPFSEEDNFIF